MVVAEVEDVVVEPLVEDVGCVAVAVTVSAGTDVVVTVVGAVVAILVAGFLQNNDLKLVAVTSRTTKYLRVESTTRAIKWKDSNSHVQLAPSRK